MLDADQAKPPAASERVHAESAEDAETAKKRLLRQSRFAIADVGKKRPLRLTPTLGALVRFVEIQREISRFV